MPARRGARSGRGWDPLPPRSAHAYDEHPPGEPTTDDDPERGNVPTRRRRASPGGIPTSDALTAAEPDTPGDPERGGFRPLDPGPYNRGRRSNVDSSGRGRWSGPVGSDDSSRGGRWSRAVGSEDLSGGGGRRGPGGGDDLSGGGRRGGSAGIGGADPVDSGRGGFGESGRGGFGGARRGGHRGGDGSGERAPGSGGAAKPEQPESERAREICLRQLAVRPRTRVELAKVLARKEISEEVIAEVLDRYDEVGIIDDAAFARAWVSSRHQGRGLARRALANELRQRGVDAEVASEALESVGDDDEAATARALVDRKLRTASGPPDAVFRRLVGMLARKGYSAGVAIRAVKDALAARDAEAAEFADQIDPDAMASDADPTS